MTASIAELAEKIAAQASELPEMYGRLDPSITPERFTIAPDAQTGLDPKSSTRRSELLANEERVALLKAYTLLGDGVADGYAALMPKYGFRGLVGMLQQACDRGVEAVPSAPTELVRFIREMEQLPAWLDADLIERGARIERNAYAHRTPFVIRGGLIATFMNRYSALPMVLTGALSDASAARRAKETASFFTATVMPDVLDRHGVGFKSAAMVRLMHSMVRFNILRRGDHWDFRTYGVPIPQVDQMPAGLVSTFLIAQKALRQGRTTFTSAERARVELARYRCFLLGLPEELLADTPQAIVDILQTRLATLKCEFDDDCAALVRATMAADLTSDRSLASRVHAWLEHGFSKVYFVANFMRGDRQAAAGVGVRLAPADYLGAATAGLLIACRMTVYEIAARIPGLRRLAEQSLVDKLSRQMADYGRPEFTTNTDAYRPAHA